MLKLYVDENYPTELAKQLQRCGIDAITAREAGNLGLTDEAHLDFAASQERVLLSFDQDYVGIGNRWFREVETTAESSSHKNTKRMLLAFSSSSA